ncbi:AAA family ATPase [uncultured Serinicoccus sp.]|uniref:AAA family ATPase n=1 Tax=uncultured Serinicoccus sp. TaxID=735514 RepID=UPI002611545C|nr:AAA family ATPase [uncultured Serinicoccus sp.]
MKFDSITADAFGPFKGAELEVGPGLTVVHGLNESGKSSWAAALYASLAGRRRSRGRGTKEDAQFRARHKPWNGTRWQVTAKITTDDGARLAVAQNLQQGSTRVIDLETSRTLTPRELQERFDIPPSTGDDIDVGQLFGLSRGTLRATTFVPQAEVLRVLEQADELQQFLQRAASSQTVDVTAHQVIERLRDELSTRVGSLSIGQRPLRATTSQLQVASEEAYRLRTARDELRQVAAELARQLEDEGRARAELTALETLEGWAELDALENRAARVGAFENELAELGTVPDAAPPELRERVHAARTAYLTLGEVPPAPEGPGTSEFEQQLAKLPHAPTGDTTPDPQVRQLWESLRQGVSALDSQTDAGTEGDEVKVPDAGSDELRRYADRLRIPRPAWDPADDEQEARLRDEHEGARSRYAVELRTWTEISEGYERAMADYRQARADYEERLKDYQARLESHREEAAAWESAQRTRAELRAQERSARGGGTWQLVVGALLTLLGLVVLVVEPVTGVVLLVLGLALVGWGFVVRAKGRRAPTSERPEPETERPTPPSPPDPPNPPEMTHPGPRPGEPLLPPRVDDIVARRARWTDQAAAFDAAREELLGELRTRGLPVDPEELQGLGRGVDEREGARRAAEERRLSADALRQRVEQTAGRLLAALGERGEEVSRVAGPEAADHAYRRYEQGCQERAALAREAGRRVDLESALAARRSEEAAHQAAVARRETTRSALLALFAELGQDHGEDPDGAAAQLGGWLARQQDADQGLARRDRMQSLRDQLLDGGTLDELTTGADELRTRLGRRPERPVPPDLDQALAEAGRRVEDAATRRATTEGRLRTLRSEEQDLASALEQEARRRRELASVEELKATLELAVEHLDAAQGETHRSLAPVLESAMRPRIPLVTGGRYRDARVDPEELTVELQERTGSWRNATYLSQGTTEQTYLLLRLALVEHLDTRETMPLVLDDVTVQCDRNRTVALLDLLADVARERQVILFSQESGVLEWAQVRLDEGAGDRLVALNASAS